VIGRLGPIEWIFNTPTHHAVHHGRNEAYIDKNFGGVLIIWDRLFGSFARLEEPVEFGINTADGGAFESHNPIVIAFHEWLALARGIVRSRSARQLVNEVVGPP